MADSLQRLGLNQLNHKLKVRRGGIEVTNGNISGSATSTGSFGQLVIGNGGDILLDEDQRIYFEADKQTWVEANGANLLRIVTNNNQMLLLDHETGNRAVFGNGTKVYIGENNNALPSETLQVEGNISSSGAIHTLSHITASGNISGVTGSFTYIESANVVQHKDDPNTGIFMSSDTIALKSNNIQTLKSRTTAGLLLGNDNYPTDISGSNIYLNAPVTASSHISASGDVTVTGV